MSLYNIKFLNQQELSEALRALGADARSLPFFENRREVRALYIPGVDTRGANVIKQEMLSRGGDAAVHARAVDFGVERSDCIVFGTKKQLLFLAEKLSTMPWWGFPEIVTDIKNALAAIDKKISRVALPGGRSIAFGERTQIMGIINLTDDSFFTDSRMGGSVEKVMALAKKQIEDGVDIIDLGAESTRPGSARVPEETEKQRIAEAVRAIRGAFPDILLSIDTTRASVAAAALEAGADVINDISGLTYEPELAKITAEFGAMYVLMHMRGTPETMQTMCDYDNLLLDITRFFEAGIEKAASLGLERSRIILDPGLGFAKNYNQNLFILKHLEAFDSFGLPLLIGASRKGTVGKATETDDPKNRLEGTIALTSLCAWQGVDIVRVHDVYENKKAVMMIEAVRNAEYA